MARPESRQVAGYFPTPNRLLSSIASTLAWPPPEVSPLIVDPLCRVRRGDRDLAGHLGGTLYRWHFAAFVDAFDPATSARLRARS